MKKKIKNNLSVIAADNDGENETEITSSQVTERERELEARGIDREPQKPLKSSKKNERSRTGYRIKKKCSKTSNSSSRGRRHFCKHVC